MQIVIDIDDEDFEYIKKYADEEILPTGWRQIINGTPLPKGHGRLIDADELKEHKYHDNHRYENAVAVCYIDWADTIIEADKSESEDKE